jgi:acyl-CoA synthetase (AMP-forming)/AMP-acid ligase II
MSRGDEPRSPVIAEDTVRELLGLPLSVALAAFVPLGHPDKVITKLTRNPLPEFAHWETWDGPRSAATRFRGSERGLSHGRVGAEAGTRGWEPMTAYRSVETASRLLAESSWAVAEPIRKWAHRKPDAPCIVCEGTVRTWRAVDERSSRLAQGLLAAGLGAQDRVIYLGHNRGEFFEILIGASKAGVVTAAVNWRLSPREMSDIIGPSRARLMFVEADFVGDINDVLERLGVDLPTVVIGGKDDGIHYERWLAGCPADDPRVAVGEHDGAVQMYTSGTTGTPRGAIYSNAAMRAAVSQAELIEVDDTSVVVIAMPVFHSVGSSFGTQALGVGATIVVARDFVPGTLLALVADHRVTPAPLVPAALKMLVESPAITEYDLSSLRTIVYAGSPISPELLLELNRRFDCRAGRPRCRGHRGPVGQVGRDGEGARRAAAVGH